MNLHIVELILHFASAMAIALSVLYLAKQVKLSKISHEQNHDWNRRIETRRALDRYDRLPAVIKLNEAFSYSQSRQPIKLNNILKELKSNPDLRKYLLELLNFYEALANGIDMGIYEELIIRESRRNNMIRTFTAFSEYVEHFQNEHNETAYVKFQSLVNTWKKDNQSGETMPQLGPT